MHATSRNALLSLVVATLIAGCQATTRPARINHVVFFKLHDAADRGALLADCDDLLAPIPGVVSYYAGEHLDTGRSSVDGNYDIGLYLGFETEEAYAAYVEHPNHKHVVGTWRPKLEWLKVYDVLDERD
jgi:hypothetical protein